MTLNVIFHVATKFTLVKVTILIMETNTRERKCQSSCAMLSANLLSKKVTSAASDHRLILVFFPWSSYFLPQCCYMFLLFICLPPKNKIVYLLFTVSVTVSSAYVLPLVSSFHILYFIVNSTLLTWSNYSSVFLSHPLDTELCLFDKVVYLLTYFMVQSPSWEANWFAASQEIPRISRNPKVHYRTHKRPSPISILGPPNPVHIPTSHLLKINSISNLNIWGTLNMRLAVFVYAVP